MPRKPFPHIALTARAEIEDKEALLERIAEIAVAAGAKVQVDASRCDLPALKKYKQFKECKGFDLVIVLGGDGTTLRTVRELHELATPLLPINRGTVGFLATCDTAHMEKVLPELLRGKGVMDERHVLSCSVQRNGREIVRGIALNEIVVSQGAIARIIELRTSVGGKPLAVFRSDGLIVATPTGSTAYSLSAGGPVIDPHLPAMILTPINAHAFSQKPFVMDAEASVDIEILPRETQFEDAHVSLTLDGQVHHALERGDHVVCTAHPERVRFLRRRNDSFVDTLREKLRWGE